RPARDHRGILCRKWLRRSFGRPVEGILFTTSCFGVLMEAPWGPRRRREVSGVELLCARKVVRRGYGASVGRGTWWLDRTRAPGALRCRLWGNGGRRRQRFRGEHPELHGGAGVHRGRGGGASPMVGYQGQDDPALGGRDRVGLRRSFRRGRAGGLAEEGYDLPARGGRRREAVRPRGGHGFRAAGGSSPGGSLRGVGRDRRPRPAGGAELEGGAGPVGADLRA